MQETAYSPTIPFSYRREWYSNLEPVLHPGVSLNRQTGLKTPPAPVFGCFVQTGTCHESQIKNIQPLNHPGAAKNVEILSYTH